MPDSTFTINGVLCSGYMDDELVESYGEEGPTATMTIMCDWGVRNAARPRDCSGPSPSRAGRS